MKNKRWVVVAALVAVLFAGLLGSGLGQPGRQEKPQTAAGGRDAGEDERGVDREAIRQAARDFEAAFAKGDAKALAAQWTATGEYQEDSGELLRGRTAIEKAFTELFKEKPGSRIQIHIESIRFPSRDSAIEAGYVRQTHEGGELPISSEYEVLHVREDGRWKIALCREGGAGRDRLHDLDWLIGGWKGSHQDQELILTFSRDKDKPFLDGHFTKKAGGKVVASGEIKVFIPGTLIATADTARRPGHAMGRPGFRMPSASSPMARPQRLATCSAV
jgi:uncharacterized protein (TIGR02246 family)